MEETVDSLFDGSYPPTPDLPVLPGDDQYVSVAGAAERLKVCNQTVYRLIREKRIPHVRIGRIIRIPVWGIRDLAKQ